MSRIFQSLGSSLDDLPVLWIAAPLTGLLVQPIVGHLSDRTWLGRLGRRRPYFLGGAILAALALLMMPLAPALLFAAILLWMLDASLNISMEPFRPFVGDMLRKDQHTAGYALQTAFIGTGAVVGSIFPYVLDHLGISNDAPGGGIPDTVRYSFWFGGAVLFLSVLWTVFSTKEYSPDEQRMFGEAGIDDPEHLTMRALAARGLARSMIWLGAGVIVVAAVAEFGIGIAWASILAMPYAILASALPQSKLGIFMGLFNVFIVVPQLLVATVMGSIMKAFFPGQPIWTMLAAAVVMLIAAFATLRVTDPGGVVPRAGTDPSAV